MSAAVGERALRESVVATARRMNAIGINRGKSGNVSAQSAMSDRQGFLITPTGIPYEDLASGDLVWLPLDGDRRDALGNRLPSSEWCIHRDIYLARPDAQAVVHTHSPFATSLACLRRGIPAFHYMVAIAGGRDIRCSGYASFGTEALSALALEALAERSACLLANHGVIATGASLDQALELAREVETLAEMYWRTLQIGEPVLLSDDEMDTVLAKFTTYGQPR